MMLESVSSIRAAALGACWCKRGPGYRGNVFGKQSSQADARVQLEVEAQG